MSELSEKPSEVSLGSGRLVGEYPEKFTWRSSTEMRIALIAAAWTMGFDGKYGPFFRWFFGKYLMVWLASLTDDERKTYEYFRKRVAENDYLEGNPLLEGIIFEDED